MQRLTKMCLKVLVLVFGALGMLQSVHALHFENDFLMKAALELQPLAEEFLQADLAILGLKRLVVTGLQCGACNLLGNLMNVRRGNEQYTKSSMAYFTKAACVALHAAKIVSNVECEGYVNIYTDTVIYLLNNIRDTRYVCSMLFQSYGCTDDRPRYEISVNHSQPLPRWRVPSPDSLPVKILQITDIHYDPTYQVGSNAVCAEHMCCTASSGVPQNPENRAGVWSDYRDCDIPDYFVDDTFHHIAETDKFDFIYFTGDIVSHQMWTTSKTSNLRDIQHIWRIFKQRFAGYQIYPIFGNHEPHPSNLYPPEYMNNGTFSIQWLFDGAADIWSDDLPPEALVTVRKGGYYTVTPRKGFKIIAINSNVGYYINFWLLIDNKDPYGQLQWLADELQKAEINREMVHILSHVTGGTEMSNSWAIELRRIIRRYHNVIAGIFNGHTHIDEFNMYYDEKGDPIAVAFNGGSLTPYNNVNPNYKIYSVDSNSYEILDYDTYMVNLTEANLNGLKRPRWQKLYSLTSEYDLPDGSAKSMQKLAMRITKEPTVRQRYHNNSVRYGTPSLAIGCDKTCQETLICNIVNTVLSDTSYCTDLLKQMS